MTIVDPLLPDHEGASLHAGTMLPLECAVEHHPGFLTPAECSDIEATLAGITELTACELELHDGTMHPIDVGTYFLGDPDVLTDDRLDALWGSRRPWPPSVQAILPRLEAAAGRRFRICLCMYYADGDRSGSMHTDLPMYGDTSVIASVSVGAERTFAFRSIADPTQQYQLDLPPGSLLIMGPGCQQMYEHGVLPGPVGCGPRFSMSFRTFGFDD